MEKAGIYHRVCDYIILSVYDWVVVVSVSLSVHDIIVTETTNLSLAYD